MNWILLLALLAWTAVPSFLLVVDRIWDVDSHRVIRSAGWAFLAGSVGLLVVTGVWDVRYLELVAWGALAGLLGTIALDIVRIIGVRLNLFPLDMPIVFGFMSLGRARTLQANVMGQVLNSSVEDGTIKEFVAARVNRIPRLPQRQRINVAAAMMGAIGTLEEVTRQEIGEAQYAAITELSDVDRRTVMAAMDAATAASAPGQPRGLPRVDFHRFRRAASAALERLGVREPALITRARAAGYLWHALNGISFGVGYALLAGQGNWGWAIAWGVFVWAVMMVAMPAMMPVLKLPAWFPIVPFLAHIAMIVPFAALTVWVPESADTASLIGWLTSP